LGDVTGVASPAQEVRPLLGPMPSEPPEDWTNISGPLGPISTAVDPHLETVRQGIADGIVPARRQVRAVIEQTVRTAAKDGFFPTFAASAPGELPASLRADLARGAEESASAYQRLTEFLGSELDPAASEPDSVRHD